ncbi:glycosyltransferase [Paenibacillus prosopidis]|uniref:Glycosyltransferase involved in cell wall biosynthesis n=1 Tax=Paenibacillus prosopidis TaxID=630520 RepID=A0A368VPC1_9BACL|nr:glycosyltransferase [Paenibacillus prosopidis]RCW42722.1 glycosyltransferase involved in cell wall biosynthesis [Paenibacillus prosopidis]
MKKNLLFVIPSLSAGGGERSLINLLSQIDYERYEVDLFLLSHEGIFLNLVPEKVQILPLPDTYNRFALPIWDSVPKFLLKGNPSLAYDRIMFSVKNRAETSVGTREQLGWRHVANSMSKIDKHYDAAIGFLEKTSIYFCVEKVSASKKIGWVHNDYDKLEMDPNFDLDYFEKLNHIVTVSDECANILKRRFPNQNHKVNVIHNIISPTVIRTLADRESTDVYNRKEEEIVILSIGRLHIQKGFDLAIKACKKLVEEGYNIQWNIIGEGDERERLTSLLKEEGLEEHFKLLGLKTNPYPYIKQADIYAQTSKFEGKAIAIDEAKILNKPIVVTNFSTAKDQIEDGVEGFIVEMNADSVAAGIGKLIQDRTIRRQMSDHLSRLKLGTEDEIEKLYKLLG